MAVKLKINDNGSLRVECENEGEVILVDGQGNPFGLNGRKAFSICRCGASANQPFCDGSHKSCGFASVVTAVELPEKR